MRSLQNELQSGVGQARGVTPCRDVHWPHIQCKPCHALSLHLACPLLGVWHLISSGANCLRNTTRSCQSSPCIHVKHWIVFLQCWTLHRQTYLVMSFAIFEIYNNCQVPLYWVNKLMMLFFWESTFDFVQIASGWVILLCRMWLGFNCWLQKRAISLWRLNLSTNLSWLGKEKNGCLVSRVVIDLDSVKWRLGSVEVLKESSLLATISWFDWPVWSLFR